MLLQSITKWLHKQLGIHIDVIPERFIEIAKDGTLLGQVLQNYNIIEPDELQFLEETCNPSQAFDNYTKYLRPWLERIHMEINEGDIYEMTHGDGTAAVTLFYELFQKLESGRSSISFIKRAKKHSFQVEKVILEKKEDEHIETNPLCEPLLRQWDVIRWERDHLASIMIKYVRSREDYDAYLENKKKVEEKSFDKNIDEMDEEALGMLKRDKTNYTYEQLIEQQKKASEMAQFEPNSDEAKKIMKEIRRKKKKRAERNAFRIQLQNELLAEVWKKIQQSEEDEFDKTVCEKLLKQSQHEKEIADKLLQIRQQKEVIIERCRKQDEMNKQLKDEEFVRRLFEEDLEARIEYHEERKALLADHKRLYEEKLRLKALKHEKVCKDIAKDAIDFALKTAEFKELYGMEPDKYTKRNWATLFTHQHSIPEFEELKELMPEEEDKTIEGPEEEIGKRNIQRLDVLDEQDLDDYIHFRNLWQIIEESEELMNLMELGMNVLGYIVHKLLLKKYPLPLPQRPKLSPEIEISVCISEMDDLSRLTYLQRLLELRSVKVIQMEDAINYCIQAYEEESKTEYEEPYPGDDEDLKEITPRRVDSEKTKKKGKKEKGGKKDKKDKKAKKDKDSKKNKKDKGDKKGKKKGKGASESKIEIVQPTLEEKQVQTPRLFPWEKVVLSNKARLGKIAKAETELEHPLNDHLLVDMFIEYLISIKDMKGWVLINFPNTYEQASLLEQALTGKAAPKDYYDTILNQESLTSVQIEEQSIITESAIEDIGADEILISIEDLTEGKIGSPSVHSQTDLMNAKGSRIKSTENVKIKTPEERIADLLPDLKKLAYSDDDNDETQQTNLKRRISSIKKSQHRCTCVCNKGSRKSSTQEEMIYFVKQTASELSQKHEIHEKHPRMSIIEQQDKIKSAEEKIMKRLTQEDDEIPFDHEEDVLNAMLKGDDSNTEKTKEADSTTEKIIKADSSKDKMIKRDSTIEKLVKDKRTSVEKRYSFENKISSLTQKVSSVRFSDFDKTHPVARSSDPEEQITELDYEGMLKETNEEDSNVQLECTCYLATAEKENLEKQMEDQVREEPTNVEETASVNDKPNEHVVVEDTYEQTRLSKILPNPRPIEKQIYNTILTAYIKIIPKEDETEDEDEYASPVFKELEKKDGLVKFYCDQGCYYVLEYLEFNAETIKCLAKMIIGDYSLPLKSSIEIFGERYKEATFEVGDHKITKKGKVGKKDKKKKNKKKDKKSKSDTKANKAGKKGAKDKKSKESKSTKSSKSGKGKKNKKEKKDKKGKPDASGHKEEIEIAHEDKEIQVPIIEEEEEELIPEPKAGEPDWEYVDLPIPEEIMLSLATLWEDTEINYIKNFKDIFYNNRVLLSDIVPFLAKTRDTMTKFIRRPDNKQYYLREFQKILNEIGLDMRSDQATKSELYCRIDEFEEKLLAICDTKMRESEEERKSFVTKNWLYRQFCEMTNNTITAFQLEIDRFIDSLQLISDYYISTITKSVNDGYEFHKEMLSKYNCNEDASENFNSILIDVPNDQISTEFHDFIGKTHEITSNFVESMKPLAFKPIAAMKKLFEKEVAEKKPKPWKKKKGGSNQKVKKFEPDEDVKENEDSIFEEWECAINGEFARIQIHLGVTKEEAFNRFNDAIEWIKKIFEEIYESISLWYENELSSVHKACEILMQSVEDETIIQEELAFEDDHLVGIRISLDTIHTEEEYKDGKFRLEQLSFMVNVLIDLARTGYILKKTFMLLIQDMLYQDDIEESTDIPTLWRNLSIKVLSALLSKLFDDEQYVYWKDFIVCNLMIPFPTREELMNVRKQFREYDPALTETVKIDDFYNVHFWFEDREDINLHLLKSIILKMYQTDVDAFNYTDMLLDFCKDEDSILGFVKALELCLGKFICCDEKMGKEYVETVLEKRKRHEEEVKEHDESILLAKRAVSLLINKIVDEAEGEGGLTITEVFDEPAEEKPEPQTTEPEPDANNEEGKIMVDHKFSYTQIGYEARDDTEIAHFLPLELVLIVIKTVLTWNSKVQKIEGDSFQDEIVKIYEECRNGEFNNVVLCHEFLNREELKQLFTTTTKFSTHNPVKLVKQIIHDDKPEIAEDVERNSQEELRLLEME